MASARGAVPVRGAPTRAIRRGPNPYGRVMGRALETRRGAQRLRGGLVSGGCRATAVVGLRQRPVCAAP